MLLMYVAYLGPRQKEDLLSCCPDVVTYFPQSSDDFIVIASDGLWDVLSSEEVIDRVQSFLIESGIYARLSGNIRNIFYFLLLIF